MWQLWTQPQLRPMMHPPPPAGWTGRAPPGAGGGAGVTADEPAAVVVASRSSADQTPANVSAATQAPKPNAAVALAFVPLMTAKL